MKKEIDLDPRAAHPALVAAMPPTVQITATSLVVLDDATEDDLEIARGALGGIEGSIMWYWGDLLLHLGETRGEAYADALIACSLAPGSRRTAVYVCRHVPPERRLHTLHFSHHQEVARESPTEQEIWLAKAEAKQWSQKTLRTEIAKSKQTIKPGENQKPADARAAAASAGLQEAISYFEAEKEQMSDEQRATWRESMAPMVAEYLIDTDDEELAALLKRRAEQRG